MHMLLKKRLHDVFNPQADIFCWLVAFEHDTFSYLVVFHYHA